MTDTIVQQHQASQLISFKAPQQGVIYLTSQALQYLQKKMAAHQGCIGIRLDLEKKGCSGLAYTVDYVQQAQASDIQFTCEQHHLRFFVNDSQITEKSRLTDIINNTTIEYIPDGLGWKLEFSNPVATGRCGCGESFSL